jgi:hypothetical protein
MTDECWNSYCNGNWQWKTTYSEKIYPSAILSAKNSSWHGWVISSKMIWRVQNWSSPSCNLKLLLFHLPYILVSSSALCFQSLSTQVLLSRWGTKHYRFFLVLLFLFKQQNVTYCWVENLSYHFANQFLKRKLRKSFDFTANCMLIHWCYHSVSIWNAYNVNYFSFKGWEKKNNAKKTMMTKTKKRTTPGEK